MSEVKTGEQLLSSFFKELKTKEGLESSVVNVLVELFESKKLTDKNIYNELEKIRKSASENKTH